MPNANYIAGRSFEYAIMRRLKLAGYWVLRAAGSKGPVDVIALKGSMVWPQLFIQCKRGRGIPSAESWNLLYDLAAGRDAIPLLASRASIKGERRVQYQRLMGRRMSGERTADLLKPYNPFGQKEMEL